VGSLNAGATASYQIAFQLASKLPDSETTLVNRACVNDGVRRACATTSDPIIPSGSPSLTLRKSYSGGPLRPGALLPFHLLVTNGGTAAATAVRLTETVPAGVTFSGKNSDPAWVCASPAAGSSCTLDLSTLGIGESREAIFAVRAPDPLPPTLRQVANAACVVRGGSTLTCDQTSTPLDVAVKLTLADRLLDDRNHDGFLSGGETLRYTLVVQNPSAQAATSLTLTTATDPHVQLLAGTVVSAAGSVVSGNHPGDTVATVFLPSLAPGASATVSFDVIALDLRGLKEISSQATVQGSNIENRVSDDPKTPEPDDPTRTALTGLSPQSVPTLSELGLALLGVLLAGLALLRLRRPRTA
jgi:uncharacterized repeat protein (TIGR01451 family)